MARSDECPKKREKRCFKSVIEIGNAAPQQIIFDVCVLFSSLFGIVFNVTVLLVYVKVCLRVI